nr:FlxA-like family protein [uncultured Duganella sp.]
MALSIGSGAGGVTNSVGAQSQIGRIMAQIKGVRKQLESLQKQLRETSDPELQKLLFKQIFDLQRTIQMMEQQIAQIEAAEQRKAADRQHDKHQPADEEKA